MVWSRIATGIAAGLKGSIFLIDTDNEFSLDYADDFKFQIVDFQPPFTPERYQGAVEYCVAQGAAVIVIDQMSHEQTGQGGVLERQQAVEEELAAKWKTTREKAKAASWNTAKTIPHGKFVSYVTRVKQPMIFNFRAKDKIKIEKNAEGKQEWIHLGYTPICTEQFDYEMTAMVILPPNSDGMPDKGLSEIRKPLRAIMRLEDQLDESLGQRLAAWAAGMDTKVASRSNASNPAPPDKPVSGPDAYITPDQAASLETLCQDAGIALERLRNAAKVSSLKMILAEDFDRALAWIRKHEAVK